MLRIGIGHRRSLLIDFTVLSQTRPITIIEDKVNWKEDGFNRKIKSSNSLPSSEFSLFGDHCRRVCRWIVNLIIWSSIRLLAAVAGSVVVTLLESNELIKSCPSAWLFGSFPGRRRQRSQSHLLIRRTTVGLHKALYLFAECFRPTYLCTVSMLLRP